LSRITRYEKAVKTLEALRGTVTDLAVMLAAIEAARTNLSSANDATNAVLSDFQSQITVIVEKVDWVIEEIDKLKAEFT